MLAGDSERVCQEITAEADAAGLEGSQQNGVAACVRYLENKREFLHYDQALTAGWPIATGVIEAACRHLIAGRLSVSGSRWGLDGAEAVLTLRAVISNGDFEEYWQFHLNASTSDSTPALSRDNTRSAPDQLAHSKRATPFQVLPRRRVARRTLAWITRHRRIVRDCERLPAHHETCISFQAGSYPRRETRVTEATGAAIMGGVLSVRMNDDAVRLLGVLDGMADIEPPGGLAAGLQQRLTAGIVRRAQVLTWANSPGSADGAPSVFPDLTGWECAHSLASAGMFPIWINTAWTRSSR